MDSFQRSVEKAYQEWDQKVQCEPYHTIPYFCLIFGFHFLSLIYRRRDEMGSLLGRLEHSLERILQSKANIPRRNKYSSDPLSKQSSDQMNDVLEQIKTINENSSGITKENLVLTRSELARKRSHTASIRLLAGESSSRALGAKKALSKRNFGVGVSQTSLAGDSDTDDDDIVDELRVFSELKSPSPFSRQFRNSSIDSPNQMINGRPGSFDKARFLADMDSAHSTPQSRSGKSVAAPIPKYFFRPDELHPLSTSSAKKYLRLYSSRTVKNSSNPSAVRVNDSCGSMVRREDVIVQEDNFVNWFDEESNRNYMNVLSTAGTVEITAIQALHLPVANRPVFVKISYGGVTARTGRAAPTAHPAWVNEEDIAANSAKGSAHPNAPAPSTTGIRVEQDEEGEAGRRQSHVKFVIDTFNSKGVFHLAVMVDDFPHNKEIAKLDISVFNLLDCICTLDTDEVYDM